MAIQTVGLRLLGHKSSMIHERKEANKILNQTFFSDKIVYLEGLHLQQGLVLQTFILDNLTLTMPNFLNGIIHITFLELSIIILGISR